MERLTADKKYDAATRYNKGESAIKLGDEFGVSRSSITRWGKQVDKFKPKPGVVDEFAHVRGPFKEFGVTGLNRFGGPHGSSLNEDYITAWENLATMIPLVKEMRDDPVIGAVLFAVQMSMRQAEWSVTPFSDEAVDKEAAEFLEQCMEDMSHTWDEHIAQALTFIEYGWATFETVYKRRLGLDKSVASQYDDGLIGWRKFAFRSQDTMAPGREWIFDEHGAILGMNQQAPPDWKFVSIPSSKMILYRTNTEKNNPQGRSALRTSWKAWYFAKNLSEIEGIAAERMGAGLPVIYLGEGTKLGDGADTDFEFAKKLVRDVRADEQMGVVIPYPKMTETKDGRGALFEFESPPSKGLIDFDKAIERYNQQIAQTLLAQFIFLGLSERGTQGLAVRITDFFSDAIEGWLRATADILNRFAVPTLFHLNATKFNAINGFPKLEAGPITKIDLEKFMDGLSSAIESGALFPDEGTERTVRQVLELPLKDTPEAGEALEPPVPEKKPETKSPDLGKDDEETDTDEFDGLEAVRLQAIDLLNELKDIDG